ncbi:PREDICTED: uncharacterized protein LOC108772354 [Cyphomyrmex costatus]|uniref:uncharacterized protein LOC108772354 n=1 Tax=Cyphomyrmex costatus TaxID=456900 RepID=UPI0008524407|nr:PREDICTED: uncharacterized protein LOC108772354 [Cyphomyrmex costatus]
MKLRSQLVELNELRVPRCVKFTADPRLVQVHGFCDASQRAYGACIYLRTETTNSYRVELLCSRSRVAPLKAISLPRLELSAALLLSQLLEKWQGPEFLRSHQDNWPSGKFTQSESGMPEMQKITVTAVSLERSVVDELVSKFSSLTRICRVLAYCLRFRKAHWPSLPTTLLSHNEIAYVLNVACKAIQRASFPNEYGALSKGKSISASSKILSLSPYMDDTGLIRVGGRLKNSRLQFDAQHPILLPREHELTKRVINYEHVRNLYAETQATMAAVRQRFWPLSLRSCTRKILRNCVTCFKAKPVQSEAIMGSLPANRVTESRPFSHCGVDYAGPVILKEGRRRNARNTKAYISVFVCFSTKAVHLELMSDLTSNAFISALRRFISRRGRPACLYSDNGTVFVGAHNQLKEIQDFLKTQQAQADIGQFFCKQEITWKFIPPNAPHFGGLWEAAVKSVKYHMA